MASACAKRWGAAPLLALVLASPGCNDVGGEGSPFDSPSAGGEDGGGLDGSEGDPTPGGSVPESVETKWWLVEHPTLSYSDHTLASEDGYRRNEVDCEVATNMVTIHLVDSGYEANDHLARAPSELRIEVDRHDPTHCLVELDEGAYGQTIEGWTYFRDECGGLGGCEIDFEVVEHGSDDNRTFEVSGTFECSQMLGGVDGPMARLVGTRDPSTLETQPGTLHLRGCSRAR